MLGRRIIGAIIAFIFSTASLLAQSMQLGPAQIIGNPTGAQRPGTSTNFTTFLSRVGGQDVASPSAQNIGMQNVVVGTSNTAGANLAINGSRGTGTGAGGNINLQYAPAGSSGSVQNVLLNMATVGIGLSPTLPGFSITPTGISNSGILFAKGTGANGGGGTITFFAHGGSSSGSPVAIVNLTELAFLQSYGWTGSAFGPTGNPTGIGFVATETWTPSANGQGILFQATPNGTTASNNEVAINSGLTALAAAENVKPGLGLGTINAENGIFDNGSRPLSANNQTITVNTNAETDFVISNNSTGTNALMLWQARNSNGGALFGVGGSGYTGIASWQNRAVLSSGTGLNGITLYATGANPINFYTNGAQAVQIFASGGVGVGTAADPGINSIAAANYFAGSTAGVTCVAGLSATTARTIKGIVTAC